MNERERNWITFAAAALTGILANKNAIGLSDYEVREVAGKMADKMLLELKAREAQNEFAYKTRS